MTPEEITAMAKEAGMKANHGHVDRAGKRHPAVNALSRSVPVEWLQAFTALVAEKAAAKEREACADIVENADTPDCGGWTAQGIADAIRARGQKGGV